ncbi:hypothetical protein MMPV_006883 [Pyropia vietnamensis]
MYAPWPGRDDAFHRSLALFLCVAPGCVGGGGGGGRTVVAYRAQLPRVSPYYPSAYDPTGGGVAPALRGGGPTVCAGCGFRAASAGGVAGCAGCTGVRVLPAMPLRIGSAGEEGSDGSWSGSDDGSGSYTSDDSDSDSDGMGGETIPLLPEKGGAVAAVQDFPATCTTTAATGRGGTTNNHGDSGSDDGHVADDSNNAGGSGSVSRSGNGGSGGGGGSGSGGGGGSGSGSGSGGDGGGAVGGTLRDVPISELEAYATAPPLSADEHAFRAFAAAVSDAPTQVLRYGAVPLWTSATGVPPSDATGGGGVPPCGACGARRAFELQVLPSLLYYLSLDNGRGDGEPAKAVGDMDAGGDAAGGREARGADKRAAKETGRETGKGGKAADAAAGRQLKALLAGGDVDWGTLAVYTCVAGCAARDGGYVEEFVWVQPPP